MKIEAVKEYSRVKNYNSLNNAKTFAVTNCGKSDYFTTDKKREEFKLNRLRAIVTGMIALGFAVIAAVLWFYFAKGKINMNK